MSQASTHIADDTISLARLQRTLILCAKVVLSLQEAAEWCDMSPRSFANRYRADGIPARKQGQKLYFLKEDLDKWMLSGELTDTAKDRQMADDVLRKIGVK